MAPTTTATKKIGPSSKTKSGHTKKEKIFHPDSRKADQLNRKAVRKARVEKLSIKRSRKQDETADFYAFFHSCIPPYGILTLQELHDVVKDRWLGRFDDELNEERDLRRKGRPKSMKEMKLEEVRLRDVETYRTGLEVPDLTHPTNVSLFRLWDGKEIPYVDSLRFIRISSTQPDAAVISKPGHHGLLLADQQKSVSAEDPMIQDPVSSTLGEMRPSDRGTFFA